MKIFFRTNGKKKTSGKRTHETAFRDEGPSEPTVNAEIEPRRSKRSRISKSFGLNFITCMIENEPQTFKEAIPTQKHKCEKKL